MDRLVQDAATVTVAMQLKDIVDVEEFLDRYTDTKEEREVLRDRMYSLNLITESYWVRDVWDEDYLKERFVYFDKWI